MDINICGIKFKNPIVIASGPGGNGKELSNYINLSRLGGFTTKTITYKPKIGNPPPRIINIENGVINSIGLENPGFEEFLKNDLPFLEQFDTNIIASIGGYNSNEFCYMIKALENTKIKINELNLSCPNVDKGGSVILNDVEETKKIIKETRNATHKPLFVKLGIEGNLEELAKICVENGADGLTLINAPKGTKISLKDRNMDLKRGYGGISGPVIKPLGLASVYRVKKLFPKIPIIGMGGVVSKTDVLEYLAVGATLVGIGYGVMLDPQLPMHIIEGLDESST
ncbi:dihydroorotate dehydrogenase [Petrotoga sp. 9PWA.NaAc.5.4]|uniref:dihydroorotate dehydrogenase n=1 Tax=Petrotoga sp. 9PWA.NaAc.5.4 TaxID=1434328 RepID=UPI000CBB99DC|nr:dihydroorotate dehydrogenase [Petrotoga sp. 9PWA.NaAc.5.4]PNR92455.1 diguanylate cyclase [Petrotoga sp. 9PWA.NaAc.5.4]